MTNNININEKAKIIMPGFDCDGFVGLIKDIQEMNGEIYYLIQGTKKCEESGEEYPYNAQVKEGQYIKITDNVVATQ